MGTFLKENWIWIVAPMVLVLVGVVVIIFADIFFGGGERGDANFIYNLW